MKPIPGLRSPYDKVGPLVFFGRMLDKIRLYAAGQLPPEYVENLGDEDPLVFDARCCRFLGLRHADLAARVRQGGTDEEILAWARAHGTARTDEECAIWSGYMTKLGWRDEASPRLQMRLRDYGVDAVGVETFFDMFDADEGRPPRFPTPDAPVQ